jgi:hypothetical protein
MSVPRATSPMHATCTSCEELTINIHHNFTSIVIIFYLVQGVRKGSGSTRSRDDHMSDFCDAVTNFRVL